MKSAIKKYPLLCSAPVVLAFLDERKSVTRRIPRININHLPDGDLEYGLFGSSIWVRETAVAIGRNSVTAIRYRADGVVRRISTKESRLLDAMRFSQTWPVIPSMNLPYGLHRIERTNAGERLEPLQTITPADVKREGFYRGSSGWTIDGTEYPTLLAAWQALWDSMSKPPYRWADNPRILRIQLT